MCIFLQADRTELRDLATDLHEKASRHETASLVTSQLKPVVTAMTSLEKTLQVQETTLQRSQQELQERLRQVQTMHQEFSLYQQRELERGGPFTSEKIKRIVDDILIEKRLGELNKATLDTAIAGQTEYLLKQVGIMGESIRLEVVSSMREEVAVGKAHYQQKIEETAALAQEIG